MKEESSLKAFNFKHSPVLANEIIESIKQIPQEMLQEGFIIDATLGGGGHSSLILESNPGVKIIGIDQDPHARLAASENLKNFGSRIKIVGVNFADFVPSKKAIMVLADLGVSSPQLDNPSRGFSLKSDGPIDMRMNPLEGINASELIKQLNEEELANIIYQYGEERFSRRIAKRIKRDLLVNGKYKGTKELAFAIAGCYPPKLRKSKIHPATRTFQALRIAVNKELEVLDKLLENAPNWILPDGLFSIISFHSLEDRRVKNSFKSDDRLERLTRKPIRATSDEISINHRSRSAKLRISRRIG